MTKDSASPSLPALRWGLRPSERRWFLLIGDLIVASLALWVAFKIWQAIDPLNAAPLLRDITRQRILWLFVPLWVLIWPPLLVSGQVAARFYVVQQLGIKFALFLMLYGLVYFIAPVGLLPRLFPFYFAIIAAVITLLWRLITVFLFQRTALQRKLIVVGAGNAGTALMEALANDKSGVFYVVGIIDDDPLKLGKEIFQSKVLGNHEKLNELARTSHATDVALAISGELSPSMFQALLYCHEVGLDIIRMPSLYEVLTGRIPLNYLNTDWILTSFFDTVQLNDFSRFLRRLLDVLGGLVGLLILGLLLPFIATAIAIESGFPIFYGQTRVGRSGKHFQIYKFRSMARNAEQGQALWAKSNDQRITRVGNILRKTRLDELPQFWNVLRGEMSLVGPRPERPEFVNMLEQHIPFYRSRLLVKPGITGWAQINYHYGGSLEGAGVKLQYDLYYVKHRSLLMDLWIIFRTFGTVLRLEGN
ncbi:MAG TPA: sugar transferase [Anaerolineales bacterium]|nr:sugar transferase [Anaerolineales bacterium]